MLYIDDGTPPPVYMKPWITGGKKISWIFQHCNVSTKTGYCFLNVLVENNLITITKKSRYHLVRLTQKGREALNKIRELQKLGIFVLDDRWKPSIHFCDCGRVIEGPPRIVDGVPYCKRCHGDAK